MLDLAHFRTLGHMSPLHRRAFVAGCAERAYDAYTYSTHPPSSKFVRALELLWASIDDVAAQTLSLTEIAEYFDKEITQAEKRAGEETLSSAAMSCLLAAIRSTLAAAADQAIATSQYLSGTAARSNAQSAAAIAEEDAWQSTWLAWCRDNDPQLARDEFNVCNEERPLWVERMEG